MKTDLLHSTAAALLAGLLLLPVTLPDSARATESPAVAPLSADEIGRLSPAGRKAAAPAGPAGLLYGLPGAPSLVLAPKRTARTPGDPGLGASDMTGAAN